LKPDTLLAATFQYYTHINVRSTFAETLTRMGPGVLFRPCHKNKN